MRLARCWDRTNDPLRVKLSLLFRVCSRNDHISFVFVRIEATAVICQKRTSANMNEEKLSEIVSKPLRVFGAC